MRSLILIIFISLITVSCYEEICSPNPCQNNGVCSEDKGTYACECPTGFSGKNCETKECNCDMRYAPVCGDDGITYGNACQAACANVTIDHEGKCVNVCSSDSDCTTGKVCVEGSCVKDPTCSSNSDCNNGDVCINGKCEFVCPEILCNLYCENGFKKDTNGCDTCECIENPNECRQNSDCNPGQICKFETYCGVGVCVDEVQCPDVMCMLACENGFKKGADGCDICECAEPDNKCQANSDCSVGEYCRFETYCGAGICTPVEVECRVDSDCGETSACIDGECKGTGLLCDNNSQCSEGEICIDGLCKEVEVECQVDADCGEDQHCELMDCEDSTDCGNGGVCVDNPIVCEDIMCALYCENGFKKDENGCDTCECIESNECSSDADCEIGDLCKITSNSDAGTCQGCECTSEYAPVCGENGITYSNACVANCARAEVSYEGVCR